MEIAPFRNICELVEFRRCIPGSGAPNAPGEANLYQDNLRSGESIHNQGLQNQLHPAILAIFGL
jgi:hypothetical protein